jgi:hypothetical protein
VSAARELKEAFGIRKQIAICWPAVYAGQKQIFLARQTTSKPSGERSCNEFGVIYVMHIMQDYAGVRLAADWIVLRRETNIFKNFYPH